MQRQLGVTKKSFHSMFYVLVLHLKASDGNIKTGLQGHLQIYSLSCSLVKHIGISRTS